ncbi:hypothetical protein [Almyronema epifaneia]|uniref:Uncharacterized protein n=1 Tax=Almyronema epifaneia S1 TaxID=2991925 RepID=A0ABW6I9D1_9CYAN
MAKGSEQKKRFSGSGWQLLKCLNAGGYSDIAIPGLAVQRFKALLRRRK